MTYEHQPPWHYRKYFEIEYHQGKCMCKCPYDEEEAQLIRQNPEKLYKWKLWLREIGCPSTPPKTFKQYVEEVE